MSENNPVSDEKVNTEKQVTDQNSVGKSASSFWILLLIIIILAGLVYGAIVLFRQGEETTGTVRDIFIIIMALEMLIIGATVIILIIQVANLTNLLQNEVRPILESTTDTVNTLKGTVKFLSDNFAEPVIKVNTTMAAGKRLFELFKPRK